LLALSQSMTEIFSARRVCLLVADHDSSEFRVYALPRQGTAEEAAPLLGLSAAQLAWAQRAERSFSPEEFLALPEQDHNHAALRKLLAGLGYELGIALHAGQHLIGFVFLGSRTNHAPFSAEDRLLFETLTPAASISISSMRLRQQMIQAQQMESLHRVTSFIMHDLRNAVSTLTVLTYNVKKQLDQVGLQADFVVILDRLSSEMRHLINKLSDSNAGNELQDRGHCDPTQLLSEVLFDLQPPSQIKVTTVIPGLPAAFWNQRQIRVVLRNILANALEAMPSGGELEVVARYQTPFIIVSIKDTGVGMPAEFIRDFLFRPNHSTKSRGLGIGLYQSREIVLAHRGTIHVQSQLGKGTTFEVHLPCTYEGVASDQVEQMRRSALPVPEHQVSTSQQELERNSLNGSWPACPQRGRPALATAA